MPSVTASGPRHSGSLATRRRTHPGDRKPTRRRRRGGAGPNTGARATGPGTVPTRPDGHDLRRHPHGVPSARHLGRGARGEGRTPDRAAHLGRYGRHGRDELRRAPATRDSRPEPRHRAHRVVERRRGGPTRRSRPLQPDHRRAVRTAARPRAGRPHRRIPADPQPGRRRRQPGRGLAGRRLPPGAAGGRPGRPGRGGLGPRDQADPDRRLLRRGEAQLPGAGRADPGRADPGRGRPAAVLQDRHPQRDGDRGLRVRFRAAPEERHRRHRHRFGRPHPAPRRRGRGVPAGRARRARPVGERGAAGRRGDPAVRRAGQGQPPPRSTTSGAPPTTGGTRSP